MAYNAPELLLVGAAQNLVLLTSSDQNVAFPCLETEREPDSVPIIYDNNGLW